MINFSKNYIILIFILLLSILIFNINSTKSLKINYAFNENEVPYISTYYINPIVNTNENVIIDFYVTDYHQKEYIEEDFSEEFTVTVKIEGKKDIIKNKIKAGDNSINLGKFTKPGEYKFSLLATDKYGRNSHELFNFFLVKDESKTKEYIMTKKDLIKYNIKNTDNYQNNNIIVDLSKKDLPTDDTEKTIAIKNLLESYSDNISIPSQTYTCILGDINGNGNQSYYKYVYVKYSDDYNSNLVLSQATNTRIGLQQLIFDKKSEGYTKLILLPGIYRIDHCSTLDENGKLTNEETICIPSEFTLDLNGSTIKQNQFAGSSSLMIDLNNTIDSHVINGTLEGDYYAHDYENSSNNSEWVTGIQISGGCKYSSVENLTIKDITGYGAGSGITSSTDGSIPIYFIYPGWNDLDQTVNYGDIDRKTGELIESNSRVTSNLLNMGDYSQLDYIVISRFLGYQGLSGDNWNFICHFYDENKNYIESIDSRQYRRIRVPKNSKYIRVTSLSLQSCWNTINLLRVPSHCAFKNVKFQNIRCVGLAQSAMNDMLIENCEFSYCGQSAATCAYDAEDGWEMMQDVTFRNNTFHDNYVNDILTCAGQNFIIENMNEGKVHFYGRTNSYVVRNCSNLTGAFLESGKTNDSLAYGRSYIRFYNNIINDGEIIISTKDDNSLKTVVKDCIINTHASGSTTKNMFLRCTIGKYDNNSDFLSEYNTLGEGLFVDCIINDKLGNKSSSDSIFINCSINNSNALVNGNFILSNCTLKNFTFNCINQDYSIKLDNCEITDSNIFVGYWQPLSNIFINNCNINNKDYFIKLPHYSLKSQVIIKNTNLISSSENGIIYFYDDRIANTLEKYPSGTITLDSNTIELKNSKFVITGLTDKTRNNISIITNNNTLVTHSIKIYDPIIKYNENISLKEN